MVLMSAVTPAPDDGSNPAMVRTTGGFSAMTFCTQNKPGRSLDRQETHIGRCQKLLSDRPPTLKFFLSIFEAAL